MKIAHSKLIGLLLLSFSLSAFAQRNELAGLVGGLVPLGDEFHVSNGTTIEGAFAHRLGKIPLLALYAEVPVTGGVNLSASDPATALTTGYSSLYITPGLKIKIAPGLPISPYLAAGAGYARFHGTQSGQEETDSKFAWDWGAGLDWKVFPHISIRGELREFRSDSVDFFPCSSGVGCTAAVTPVPGHNLVGMVGLVLRF
jgi:hypothetical protein